MYQFTNSQTGEKIYIGKLPGLKKPALALGGKYVISKVASFDNEACAEDFYNMLSRWLNAKMEEENGI